MDILTILIIIILALFPFGETLWLSPYANVAFRPLDIAVGVAALVYVIKVITNRKLLKSIQFNKPIILFICICILSLLSNFFWLKQTQFITSSLYIVRWIAYASIFWIMGSLNPKNKNLIYKIFYLDGIILVLIGFIQYFLYSNLANLYYLGWDNHLYRLFSTFLDPDYAGAFFVLFLLFLAGQMQQYSRLKNRKYYYVTLVSIILTLIALGLTYSRSALIMLIAGAVVYFILINKRKLLLYLGILMVAFVLLISPFFYIESINLFRVNSSVARIYDDNIALKIFASHPIIGVGFDSYRYAKLLNGIREDWNNEPSHADAGVSNSFLYVLATTGVIGFLSYIYLWCSIVQKAYILHQTGKKILPAVVISSTIGLFFDAVFINSLFFPEIMLWMWILVGFMDYI